MFKSGKYVKKKHSRMPSEFGSITLGANINYTLRYFIPEHI